MFNRRCFFEAKGRDVSVKCDATSKPIVIKKENRLTGYKVGEKVYLVNLFKYKM
jgi:hypothetical protein